jgi:hypothetical protein
LPIWVNDINQIDWETYTINQTIQKAIFAEKSISNP